MVLTCSLATKKAHAINAEIETDCREIHGGYLPAYCLFSCGG
jgi:hypothetical protein